MQSAQGRCDIRQQKAWSKAFIYSIIGTYLWGAILNNVDPFVNKQETEVLPKKCELFIPKMFFP